MAAAISRRDPAARGALLLAAAGGIWVVMQLLWAVQAALPNFTDDTLSTLGMIPRLLVLFGLPAVHRVQRGRAGALGATGLGMTLVGLALDVLGRALAFLVHGGQDDPAPGVALGAHLAFLGFTLVALGLLLYGVAALRARVLPLWGRLMPLLIAVLTVLSKFDVAAAAWAQFSVSTLHAGAWTALAVAAYTVAPLSAPAGAPAGAPAARASVWRPFVSLGTIVSGLLAVGVWSLEWNPAVALLVVLLLYVHEAGHVTAALLRGATVEQAPFFLPGFGAFVQTGRTRSAWDEMWISLGGPAIGGAVALLAKLVGLFEGIDALAHAGDFALILNLMNLAPFSPLDGGRVAGLTGWFGFALTAALGAAFVLQGPGLFLSLLVGAAVVQAFRSARRPAAWGWRTRAGIAAVYLGLIVVEGGALFLSGDAPRLPSNRPTGWPSAGDVFELVFYVYIAGTFLLPYAWREEQSARVRYTVSALVGWPQYLLGRPWMIPITVCLAAHTFGVPGLAWLEGLLARWSAAGNRAAAHAAALGFDCLWRERTGESGAAASAWLDRMTPALERGGPAVLGGTYLLLVGLDHERRATDWIAHQNAGRLELLRLTPEAANTYAWSALVQRREADALPYARIGAAEDPENDAPLDTLGQVLLASGDPAAAEDALRRSLALGERPGTRIALARALAAQQRFAEAVAEAKRALADTTARWHEDEPGQDEVEQWLQEWRVAATR